jgi:hypothetical protein
VIEGLVSTQPDSHTRNDWVTRPGAGFSWWCLPLGVGFAANFLALPVRGAAIIWVILFAWMGTGCILNARRCHRLHCYISGPACSQQHRRGYAGRYLIIICSRDLEKVRLINDSSRAALGSGDRRPTHKNKTHSNRPLLASAAFCTGCIRKNTDTHPSACSPAARAHSSDRSARTQG